MAKKVKPRVKLPKSAEAGEVVQVKTLISHKMESGQRKDKDGNTIPRSIINKFICKMNGEIVFQCDLEPAISANPYFAFSVKVEAPGAFDFEWFDDDGSTYQKSAKVKVS